MELRYLRIDSLCIVQDDPDDWSKEAPRMGQLYSRAHLVIAASGARDSSEGCFINRTAPISYIEIPFKKEGGVQDGHVQLGVKNSGAVGLEWEPLGKGTDPPHCPFSFHTSHVPQAVKTNIRPRMTQLFQYTKGKGSGWLAQWYTASSQCVPVSA